MMFIDDRNEGHWPSRDAAERAASAASAGRTAPVGAAPLAGCPLCGYDYSTWSLIGQYAHLSISHTWWERLKLWWRVGSLRRMVIARKYGGAA